MFNRETVRKIHAECEEALKAVAERHGLDLLQKNITFTEGEMPVSFRLVARREDGVPMSREAEIFKQGAEIVGLEPAMLGARFKKGGQTYRIVGLNLRAQRFPVIAEDSAGRRFRFPAETVKALVGVGAGV